MGKLFAVDSQKRRNGGIFHVNDLPMNYSFTSHNKIKIPFPPKPPPTQAETCWLCLMCFRCAVSGRGPASPACGTTCGTCGTGPLLEGTSPRAERGSRAVGLSQERCQRCYKPVERPLTVSNLLLLSNNGRRLQQRGTSEPCVTVPGSSASIWQRGGKCCWKSGVEWGREKKHCCGWQVMNEGGVGRTKLGSGCWFVVCTFQQGTSIRTWGQAGWTSALLERSFSPSPDPQQDSADP